MKIPSKTEFVLLQLLGDQTLTGRELHALSKAKKKPVAYGTIYTTMKRLKDNGWIEVEDHAEDDRKKLFSVRKNGIRALGLMQELKEALGQ